MSATTVNTNLKTNPSANTTATDPNSVLKAVYHVWKYTECFHPKHFAKKINKTIWKKVPLLKDLRDLIKSTKKLQDLWTKTKTTKRNTPFPTTPTVVNHLKNIILARDKRTRDEDVIQGLELYISLSKTTPEIFKNLLSKKGALVKTDKTIYWAVAVRVIGENFALKVKIKIPLSGCLISESKKKSKKLSWNFQMQLVKSDNKKYLNAKKEARPPKKSKSKLLQCAS